MKSYSFIKIDERTALKSDANQWMMCEWKSKRWIPTTFHHSLVGLLHKVLDRNLRESGARQAKELLDALSRENQKLIDAITE